MDDFWYDPVCFDTLPSSHVICQLCNELGHTAIECLRRFEPSNVHNAPSFSLSDWLYPEQNEFLNSNDCSSAIEEPLTDVNESTPSLLFEKSNWYIEDLLDQLYCLRKLSSQSLKNYFSEAKSISYALDRAGYSISEIELMDFLVDGLDPLYEKFVKYYYFRKPQISLDFLFDFLIDEEKQCRKSSLVKASDKIQSNVFSNSIPNLNQISVSVARIQTHVLSLSSPKATMLGSFPLSLEGETAPVGAPIGLMAETEEDIPIAKAQAAKASSSSASKSAPATPGALPPPVAAPAPPAAVPTSPPVTSAAGIASTKASPSSFGLSKIDLIGPLPYQPDSLGPAQSGPLPTATGYLLSGFMALPHVSQPAPSLPVQAVSVLLLTLQSPLPTVAPTLQPKSSSPVPILQPILAFSLATPAQLTLASSLNIQEKYSYEDGYILYPPTKWKYMPCHDHLHLYMRLLFNHNRLMCVCRNNHNIIISLMLHLRGKTMKFMFKLQLYNVAFRLRGGISHVI